MLKLCDMEDTVRYYRPHYLFLRPFYLSTPPPSLPHTLHSFITPSLFPQDFVIYLLGGSSTVIVRHRGDGEVSKVDVQLSGPDIQPRHCCLRRRGNGSSTWLRPFGCAVATRNGEAVSEEAELGSGDVIGLGGHYLFLFKDPTGLVTPPQVCTVRLDTRPEMKTHTDASI